MFLFVKFLSFFLKNSVSFSKVDAVPKIIDSSENTSTYYGSKITLFCTSEGSPMPNITWSKSRSKISTKYLLLIAESHVSGYSRFF